MSIYEYLNPTYRELPIPIPLEEWRKNNPSSPSDLFTTLLPNQIVRVEKPIPNVYEVFETDSALIGRNRAIVSDGTMAWETETRNIYKGFDKLLLNTRIEAETEGAARRYRMNYNTETFYVVSGSRVLAGFSRDGKTYGGLQGVDPQEIQGTIFDNLADAMAYIKSIL